MKKILMACLSLLLVLALTGAALAEEDISRVRVSGNATVALAADTATLQIGVNTRADTVREAQAENAGLMNAVLQAIYALGLDEKDVITSHFNVHMNYDFSNDVLGREIRTPYYQVENMLCVTVRNLSQVGAVLDAAMEAGANTSYGITFSSTEENDAYQKALTRAVEDAAKKAQVLAAAAGKELGELTLIDASQGGGFYGISNVYDAKAEERAYGTAIISGDVSVSASVILEYELK